MRTASAIDFAPGYAQGRTIANLAAQIGARFGATPGTAALAPLASTGLVEAIARASHVVVLLLDGVGCAQLEGLSPAGSLARARICELDSTFPSSTAPAVTTFATGEAPGSHAVTGWHMWSQRHQSVVRPLPLDYWGQPGHIDARELFGWIPLSARMRAAATVLQPAWIADSAFTRYAFSEARRLGYSTLDDVRRLVAESMQAPAPGGHHFYVYLPHFDINAHEYGWSSDQTNRTIAAYDALFSDLAADLARSGALLIATADHGFIDVPGEQILRLEAFPELACLLDGPLTGEPRVAFCRVRRGFEGLFADTADKLLGFAFDCHPSEALIEAGCFGPAQHCGPALRERVGSYTLVGKDRYCLTQTLNGEMPASFIGMHGGTHPDEVRVGVAAVCRGSPLCA